MDVLNLHFDNATFDIAIDKGQEECFVLLFGLILDLGDQVRWMP